jgi:hypothetical protein
VSVIVFLPAGFFMTGTSAKLPVGTAFKAFLDEDLALEIAPVIPQPMVIGAPAPAVAVNAAATAPATMLAVSTVATAPVAAVPPGPPRAIANTQSGFCLDVPKGYAGTGSAASPMVTTAMPACSSIGRK